MKMVNPDSPILQAMEGQYYKLLSVVMDKYKLEDVQITCMDLERLTSMFGGEMPCLVVKQKDEIIHLSLVPESEAKRLAEIDAKERSKVTLSGKPADGVTRGAPQPIDQKTGMHKDYFVLSGEERAKGFIRPVRQTYIHTGRQVCRKIEPTNKLGGQLNVCAMPLDHTGEHWLVSQQLSQPEAVIADREHRIGGCGTATKMSRPIAETYARDPKFYGSTFCCSCRTHISVLEFEWEDGKVVGS